MRDPKRRAYLDQLKTFLREQLSDRQLEARITSGIEKAELHDLTSAPMPCSGG
jgi:hypothetical protein